MNGERCDGIIIACLLACLLFFAFQEHRLSNFLIKKEAIYGGRF